MCVVAVGIAACSDSGTVTSEAKLQQAPSAASQVLVTIPQGSTLKVGECSNGWCRASFKGRDGYLLAKSVRLSERAFRHTPEEDQPRGEDEPEDAGNTVAPPDAAPQSSAN
jgi:uncharacterized protein YraI